MLAETIRDEDELYRCLFLDCVKPDESVSRCRAFWAAAFMTSGRPGNELSVHLGRITTPSEILRIANRPSFGEGSLLTLAPGDLGFQVAHAPTDLDLSHTLISREEHKAEVPASRGSHDSHRDSRQREPVEEPAAIPVKLTDPSKTVRFANCGTVLASRFSRSIAVSRAAAMTIVTTQRRRLMARKLRAYFESL